MKLFARQESLSDAIGWWITLDRLLGLRVFEYPRGQPRPVLSFIYLLVLYGFYCSTITLQNFYYINNRLLKLEYVFYQLLMYINFLTVLIKLILGWWHTKVRQQARNIQRIIIFEESHRFYVSLNSMLVDFHNLLSEDVGDR
jgi:hypothetical protein